MITKIQTNIFDFCFFQKTFIKKLLLDINKNGLWISPIFMIKTIVQKFSFISPL